MEAPEHVRVFGILPYAGACANSVHFFVFFAAVLEGYCKYKKVQNVNILDLAFIIFKPGKLTQWPGLHLDPFVQV